MTKHHRYYKLVHVSSFSFSQFKLYLLPNRFGWPFFEKKIFKFDVDDEESRPEHARHSIPVLTRIYTCVCRIWLYYVCLFYSSSLKKKKNSLFSLVLLLLLLHLKEKSGGGPDGARSVMMMYLHISFSFLHIETRESLVFLRESGGADEMLFHDGKRLELLNAIVHTRVGTTTTTTRRHICIA